MHLDTERIDRLLAGELTPALAASTQQHLASCPACRVAVERARASEHRVHALLGTLDHPKEPPRFNAVTGHSLPGHRRAGFRAAAAILLAVGLGGVAYALPATGFRTFILSLRPHDAAPAVLRDSAVIAAPEMSPLAGIAMRPGSRLLIEFMPVAGGEARVVLSDGNEVTVRAPEGAATFSSEADRLVIRLTQRTILYVEVPRAASHVDMQVSGRRIFLKDGAVVSTSSATDSAGAWVLQLGQGTERSSRDPTIPTAWVTGVTNRFYPLAPGTTFRFEGAESVTVEVLRNTRRVNGVVATVVRDRAYAGGEVTEDTFDWFAQDSAGNVWYLGEDTKELRNGRITSTAGSWEWGRDGALPGIVMWSDPAAHVGQQYRQEYRKGVAEDMGKVTAIDVAVTVRHGKFTGCVRTEDTSPLEPGVRELKVYCPGLGIVLSQSARGKDRVELAEVTGP